MIDEIGLIFYCIWWYCLKYRDIGINFEVFDWKVVMFCFLFNGSLILMFFREDVLELFNLFIYLYFFMYFMGVSVFRELYLFFFKCIGSRCNLVTLSFFSCGLISLRSLLKSNGDFFFERKDIKLRRRIVSSITDSDDELEGGCDIGYISNCEYFISSNYWDIEE